MLMKIRCRTDQRMVDAAAFAVEKCLKQTKGQDGYICLDDESAEDE